MKTILKSILPIESLDLQLRIKEIIVEECIQSLMKMEIYPPDFQQMTQMTLLTLTLQINVTNSLISFHSWTQLYRS
jgi:hypothetical protein